VREVVFAEQNWHVYRNHSRMVRFGDFVYIKNNYSGQPNLCLESHQWPAGKDLWEVHAAGRTTTQQQQIFANPCFEEELFRVSKDPNQFENLASNPEYAETLQQARQLIANWTEQTGDTIPENPSPNRHAPPRIEGERIIPAGSCEKGKRNPHSEIPGAARNATEINHPGPVSLR
jgi:N-sulfoglucosamine sulfohydrolase